MKSLHIIALWFVSCFSTTALWAQTDIKLNTQDAKQTEWKAEVTKPSAIKKGEKLTIQFHAKVTEPGWHLYSCQEPPNGMGYFPTSFSLEEESAKGVKVVKNMTESPAPHAFYDELMQDTVRMFEVNEVTYTQDLSITGKDIAVVGELSYQICKEVCIFVRVPFEFYLKAD